MNITKGHEPKDRLTRIGDSMLKTFNEHAEKHDVDRAIVFLKDSSKGGIGISGYEDDKEAVMDLVVHLRAMFRTHGVELHFLPVGGVSLKERA